MKHIQMQKVCLNMPTLYYIAPLYRSVFTSPVSYTQARTADLINKSKWNDDTGSVNTNNTEVTTRFPYNCSWDSNPWGSNPGRVQQMALSNKWL